MTIFKICKTVYLDKITKCYKNIFYINNPSNDISLNLITKVISPVKLSPFQTFSNCCEKSSCMRVFINFNTKELLKEDEIDILFSQLINAGFNIEYKLTKLIKEKNVICLISK